jgi:hypothetical protein
MHLSTLFSVCAAICALNTTLTDAEAGTGSNDLQGEKSLKLSPVPVAKGLKLSSAGELTGYLQRHELDPDRLLDPDLAHDFRSKRLFYVFYNTAEDANPSRRWMLQRIRKEVRNYRSTEDQNPEVHVTYLVEAFKLRNGKLKKPDQHYGSFGTGRFASREITKTFEIGYGTIPGTDQTREWPFAPNKLYRLISPYGKTRTTYDSVRFSESCKWTLRVVLHASGEYEVAAEELGLRGVDPLTRRQERLDAGRVRD